MFHLSFVNDFTETRRNARKIISEHLEGRGEFSVSYVAQLLSATIVCTLGLITNSTAVIIGGMIIAPLMWPILNVSYRLATKKSRISINPFAIVVASSMVIFLGAAFVAFLTPYKEITSEILLRTSPTSLEIFIALAAALIAALAVTLPKISDSVAGVAVATSLVPPLCVSGIGLAYFNMDVLYGGLLLFLTNTLTIMLVSTFVFSMFVYGRDFTNLKKKQVTVIVMGIVLLSFPLYSRLEDSIASSTVSSTARTTIEDRLEEYAPNSELESYQITLSPEGNEVSIRAVVLLPPSRTISFEEEEELVAILSAQLDKQVDLQLVQQESIRPATEKEIQEIDEQKRVESIVSEQLNLIKQGVEINSLNAELTEGEGWDVVITVRSSFDLNIDAEDIAAIEEVVESETNRSVKVSVEIIESIIVGGEQSERESLASDIKKIGEGRFGIEKVVSADVGRISGNKPVVVDLVLLIGNGVTFNQDSKNTLEKTIEKQTGRKISLKVSIVELSSL